jgi:hypothetical protein
MAYRYSDPKEAFDEAERLIVACNEHRGKRDAAWLEVTKQLDRVIARLKKKRGA